MIRNFFAIPNVIGRLMIIMFFVGGVAFAGAFDGFVVETEASSCCCRGTDNAIFSSSEYCDEADDDDEACDCTDSCADNDACPDGKEDGCKGNTQQAYCHSGCSGNEDEGCDCTDLTVCNNETAQQCWTSCTNS